MRSFKNLLIQAEVPTVRFHELRHSSASIMINHDIPVIIVSRRFDHVRTSITMGLYGYKLPSIQDEAAQLIDELVPPTVVKIP